LSSACGANVSISSSVFGVEPQADTMAIRNKSAQEMNVLGLREVDAVRRWAMLIHIKRASAPDVTKRIRHVWRSTRRRWRRPRTREWGTEGLRAYMPLARRLLIASASA